MNQFVILPFEKFVALQKLLEDAKDLADLREAIRKEGDAASISLEELKDDLGHVSRDGLLCEPSHRRFKTASDL